MEWAAQAMFVLYALFTTVGAFITALSGNLVRALVGLILTLFGVAGLYMLLNAPFIALMQLLIYVGAVTVLIFFAIMLTKAPAGGEEREPTSLRKILYGLMASTLPCFLFAWVAAKDGNHPILVPQEIPLAELGKGLMEPYVLAFELISVVLLVAMSGAVVLVFKRRKGQ